MAQDAAVFLGIDDTDTLGSPGTNQLARHLAESLPAGFTFVVALRHQLLFDRRVPYTSKNGCASLLLRAEAGRNADELVPVLRDRMRAWYVPGSDPGLCVATRVPEVISAFGARAKRELVRQEEARALARETSVHLEGLGGTEDGVIGALAAVGLLARGDDGRVVHLAGWPWPDDAGGPRSLDELRARGVAEVRELASGRVVDSGMVDVGKRLRPSWRQGRAVLHVEPIAGANGTSWRALKLP